MAAQQALISIAGLLSVVVAMLADGRRAVPLVAIVLAAGLSPELLIAGGAPAAFVFAGAGAAALLLHWVGAIAGSRVAPAVRFDPTIPVFAPPQQLFGRRSVRVAAAALAVPVASWVTLNMPVGEVVAIQGLLFPAAYAWCCGALRLVVARSIADLAAGISMIVVATAVGWVLRSGSDALTGALAILTLVPLCALAAGWLGGRHEHRAVAEAGTR
jgi:hypothetical protein